MPSTRRGFLSSMAAAGAALPLAAQLPATSRTRRPMKILVLGGTAFLGPHFVRAALANGHEVTLFNRGKTNPELFQDLERLRGDRDKYELAALKGREWDAVVDTSAYVPGHVRAAAELLAGRVGHYQVISTVSVYNPVREQPPEVDEAAAVGRVSDDVVAATKTIRDSFQHYGPMKALCEEAAAAVLPDQTCVLRPGLIVGPMDRTDRFTYWPKRMQSGGEVLCPGQPDDLCQFIDVRDLAAFMLRCVEQDVTGTYNALGFAGDVSFGDVLAACKCASSAPVQMTWVDDAFLLESGVGPFVEMAMWVPKESLRKYRNERALAAGMQLRPIAETIRDTIAWVANERGDAELRAGLRPDRERELLAAWRERSSRR